MATTPRQTSNEQPKSDRDSSAATARETAAEIGADVKQAVHDRLEDAQESTSDSLKAFADAIRHAGDELAGKDQGPAAQILSQAAGSLERISSAIGRKRIEDIISDVRHFGRDHPGSFMLASVLVGVALGRFAQSAVPSDTANNPSNRAMEPSDNRQMAGGTNGIE
jgi:hypothetical protein